MSKPNADIDGATWDTYRHKDDPVDEATPATWAVKLPIDVEIADPEGGTRTVKAGDYLCINGQGMFYTVEQEPFNEDFERIENPE